MNLENLGVQEMNTQEMKNVDGGWLPLALAIASAIIYVVDNWDKLGEGYEDGYGNP